MTVHTMRPHPFVQVRVRDPLLTSDDTIGWEQDSILGLHSEAKSGVSL